MTSVTFADPWLEGSVAMEKEVVTQMEELNRSLSGQSSSSWSSNIDDSLTSLHWLQEFSISSASRGPHMSSHQHMESPTSPSAGDLSSIGLSQTPSKATAASYSRAPPKRVSRGQCLEEVDFSTRNIRPPFSYTNLIHLAMQASNLPKITLACINKWIKDSFCYYRHADPTWQNSIRQTLSKKKCFVRVPRQNNEPGKGGFWAFDPQHARLSGKNRKLNQNNKQEVKSEPTTSSPLLPVPRSPVENVKEDLSAIFDWDTLVDSAIDEYFGKNEGGPLSPVESQEAQVSSEFDVDLFLEAELTGKCPEIFWNMFEGTDVNILGCSTENIEPV